MTSWKFITVAEKSRILANTFIILLFFSEVVFFYHSLAFSSQPVFIKLFLLVEIWTLHKLPYACITITYSPLSHTDVITIDH